MARPGRSSKAKSKTSSSKSAVRRAEIRRTLGRPGFNLRSLLDRPDTLNALVILLLATITASMLIDWSRDQPRVRDGQVMTSTRLTRLDYAVVDEAATAAVREEARMSAPRMYRVNEAALARLKTSLQGLPTALANVQSLDEVSAEVRRDFPLTEESLAALRELGSDNVRSSNWNRWIDNLISVQLIENPLIPSDEYQVFVTSDRRLVRTSTDGETRDEMILGSAIELSPAPSEDTRRALKRLIDRAGIPSALNGFIFDTIIMGNKASLVFDAARTATIAQQRADAVEPLTTEHKAGEVIYRRGDVLTPAQYNELMTEREEYEQRAGPTPKWISRFGTIGLMTLLLGFSSIFVGQMYPRIARNAWRTLAICTLLVASLALVCVVSARVPAMLFPGCFAVVLFVSILTLVAYDQRLALFLAALECTFVTLAVDAGVAMFVLLLAACGITLAQLRELRHRNALIRAALVSSIAVGVGVVGHAMLTLPLVDGIIGHIVARAMSSMAATAGVGFLMLGILPSVERWFDITTGMTLAELRDPRQPLLRQLQQKAPGTYNHSLQVASIAEAAADAIGADSLLVYVGALYHDIGKMNKPEYFIENQSTGDNKHERLSPAMSLLVIIGHVKDGVELAREFNLPRPIQHFIESHHGTTLVEYFYHAARNQAESDERTVDEVEFRYPGPKPRTREAACMMLADCVESATRAMTEPNPARIERLVRELSHKRLIDGQFARCDLTFRELREIEDAIISRVCAIHHGRIAYPSADKPAEDAHAVSTA